MGYLYFLEDIKILLTLKDIIVPSYQTMESQFGQQIHGMF